MSRVIAIVEDTDFVAPLEDNGVVEISAPLATAAMVEDFLDRPGVTDLFEIRSNQEGARYVSAHHVAAETL